MGWLWCPGIVWGPIRETCLHATCPGPLVHSHFSSLSYFWLIHGTKSGVDACQLIFTKKKKKSSSVEWFVQLPPEFLPAKKQPPSPPVLNHLQRPFHSARTGHELMEGLKSWDSIIPWRMKLKLRQSISVCDCLTGPCIDHAVCYNTLPQCSPDLGTAVLIR